MRVATLNVWNRLGPWEDRKRAIRDQLARLSPDIIGLEEVVRLDDQYTFDELAELGEGLGYHSAYGRSPEAPPWGNGNALFSRWPVASTMVFPLEGTDEGRSLLACTLDSPYGPLPLFVTHLNWMFHEGHIRCRQVRAIVDHIERLAPKDGFPPILVGDFNAAPDADEIRFLGGLTPLGGKSVYFADCFGLVGEGPGHTFSRKNPFAAPIREPNRRIDYVFVRGPDSHGRGEPLEAHVCFDTPTEGTFPSDHFGVVATLSA